MRNMKFGLAICASVAALASGIPAAAAQWVMIDGTDQRWWIDTDNISPDKEKGVTFFVPAMSDQAACRPMQKECNTALELSPRRSTAQQQSNSCTASETTTSATGTKMTTHGHPLTGHRFAASYVIDELLASGLSGVRKPMSALGPAQTLRLASAFVG